MNINEMSNEFDVLYNNITSNQAPGLDEYEKSVFLTKAQSELVKSYFNAKTNKPQDGFDDSPIRQADFSTIISTSTLKSIKTSCFDPRSKAFSLPDDLFISLNEQLVASSDGLKIPYTVVPISFAEYNRLMAKPYKYPPKFQAWRLITKNTQVTSVATSASGKYIIDSAEKKLVTWSDYGKPVRLIVKTTKNSEADFGIPPKVVETSTMVTITCEIRTGVQMSKYYSVLTNPQLAIEAGGVDVSKYFAGSSEGIEWPNFTAPENVVTMYDILNLGGVKSGTALVAEIIGRFGTNSLSYNIRYIRKLKPIILTSLSLLDSNLSIEGETEPMGSELPEEFHPDIVQRAVEFAKAAYSGDLNSQIALGMGSATDKGIVSRS